MKATFYERLDFANEAPTNRPDFAGRNQIPRDKLRGEMHNLSNPWRRIAHPREFPSSYIRETTEKPSG